MSLKVNVVPYLGNWAHRTDQMGILLSDEIDLNIEGKHTLSFFFFFFSLSFFFLSFVLLGPHHQHMEVPRLGVYSCRHMPEPQQHQIQAASATCS